MKEKKHICIGLLAHVDAGKTTLSEGLLYCGGAIRSMGRVDKQNAYLDTDAIERERGITVYAKQARLSYGDCSITLLDTPGHVDFSAEMERTLQALDYAVLVVSCADGVQGHTRTLWRLLRSYGIPVFFFVNKMDQAGADARRCLKEIQRQLTDACISFEKTDTEDFFEEAAMCSEEALDAFLKTGKLEERLIRQMIAERKLFPCYFGSALKYMGVEELLRGICRYTQEKQYPEAFGARVFKIAREETGQRLTFLKVTGGSLKVRTPLAGKTGGWEEKISQIRLYSGGKYETVDEVSAGEVCAVTGLSETYPGQGLGMENSAPPPLLDPVLNYRILLPEGVDALQTLPKLRQLEEEDPLLHVIWNETHQEILVQVMGDVQTEILKRQVFDRFGIEIGFGAGHIVYKETISGPVEGAGHFEPLRHYAEVHLLLEPGERGSGLVFASDCREEILDKNWQRLILSHLAEKTHIGVLTGSAITDMKITLISGRAHQKHTEGGDFRQATYRAVRQGLRSAQSILLEPYYEYRLETPEHLVGRAMTDLEMRSATIEGPEIADGAAVITGKAPVSAMREYTKEVAAYTKGSGKLSLSSGGYDRCRNPEAVIAEIGYDADADLENSADSVFCSHGAGILVPWHEASEHMHLESIFSGKAKDEENGGKILAQSLPKEEEWIAPEEVDSILARTLEANKRDKAAPKRGYKTSRRIVRAEAPEPERHKGKKEDPREEYLLVDGYNIIYAWEELRELSKENMDGARGRLLDILCNYQGMKKCGVIAVFDAYRVSGHTEEIFDYHNIHVVYTREAETADAYIEKFAHQNSRKYNITVATSDGMEQIIIRGAGCLLLSAKDFLEEIGRLDHAVKEEHIKSQKGSRIYLLDRITGEEEEKLRKALKESEETK